MPAAEPPWHTLWLVTFLRPATLRCRALLGLAILFAAVWASGPAAVDSAVPGGVVAVMVNGGDAMTEPAVLPRADRSATFTPLLPAVVPTLPPVAGGPEARLLPPSPASMPAAAGRPGLSPRAPPGRA